MVGQAKLILTSFCLTTTAVFDSHKVVPVCLSSESVKALLLKGKAPVDPECTAKVGKVRDSGTDVQSMDVSQRASFVIRTPVWDAVSIHFRNPLQNMMSD